MLPSLKGTLWPFDLLLLVAAPKDTTPKETRTAIAAANTAVVTAKPMKPAPIGETLSWWDPTDVVVEFAPAAAAM